MHNPHTPHSIATRQITAISSRYRFKQQPTLRYGRASNEIMPIHSIHVLLIQTLCLHRQRSLRRNSANLLKLSERELSIIDYDAILNRCFQFSAARIRATSVLGQLPFNQVQSILSNCLSDCAEESEIVMKIVPAKLTQRRHRNWFAIGFGVRQSINQIEEINRLKHENNFQ